MAEEQEQVKQEPVKKEPVKKPKGKSEGKGGKKTAEAAPKAEGKPQANIKGGARLRQKFEKEVRPALMKELELSNPMAVPRLEKVVINMGVGEATQNAKLLDPAAAELTQITGQKPVITKAKKSIAAFKVRAGMPIGVMVTLRGDRMFEFLDRLMNVALPRVRDFRGVPTKAFDGRGNYTLGLRDQLVFPEIDYSKVEKLKGMNITVVTTARTDDQARALLKHLGMPFRP
jgi:large subunit ribosomal protein L5